MKASIKVKDLLQVLNISRKFVSKKLPILQYGTVGATNNTLSIMTTDLDGCCVIYINANISEEGAGVVPIDQLYRLAKTLYKNDNITLDVNNDRLTVSYGNDHKSVDVPNYNDFPDLNINIDSFSKHMFNEKELKTALKSVLYACSKDVTRPILGGVLFYKNSCASTTMVATGGYRLAETTLTDNNMNDMYKVIPASFIKKLTSILKSNEDITIANSSEWVEVAGSNYKIMTKCIDGQFPDYKQLIKVDSSYSEVILNRLSLISLLDTYKKTCTRVSLEFNRENIVATFWNITKQVSQHDIQDYSYKTYKETVPTLVCLDLKYLIDALNAINDDLICVSFSYHKPFVITPTSSSKNKYMHLIMPLNR